MCGTSGVDGGLPACSRLDRRFDPGLVPNAGAVSGGLLVKVVAIGALSSGATHRGLLVASTMLFGHG